jgi:hypothetical protein
MQPATAGRPPRCDPARPVGRPNLDRPQSREDGDGECALRHWHVGPADAALSAMHTRRQWPWPGKTTRCSRGDWRRMTRMPSRSGDAAHRRVARVAAQGPGSSGTGPPARDGGQAHSWSGTPRAARARNAPRRAAPGRVSGEEWWRRRGPDPARGRGAARPGGTAPDRRAAGNGGGGEGVYGGGEGVDRRRRWPA